jgi:hypothetical protein
MIMVVAPPDGTAGKEVGTFNTPVYAHALFTRSDPASIPHPITHSCACT